LGKRILGKEKSLAPEWVYPLGKRILGTPLVAVVGARVREWRPGCPQILLRISGCL